jgi:hypothetical protein
MTELTPEQEWDMLMRKEKIKRNIERARQRRFTLLRIKQDRQRAKAVRY